MTTPEGVRRMSLGCTMRACGALLVAVPLSTAAGQPRPVDRIPAVDMARAATQTNVSDARGAFFRAASDGNAQYVLNRRTSRSQIELHCEWDDLLVVRSGAGTLRHGSKLKGLDHYAWSEWRAKEILGATEVNLGAGDVLRVPAGEAHEVVPLGDAPLVYLVVKVRSATDRACASLPNRGR